MAASWLICAGRFPDYFVMRLDKAGPPPAARAHAQPAGYPPMRDYVIGREPSCSPCFLKRDLRGQNGARIAHGDQDLCMWKASKDSADVITVGWSFFHPARDRIERASQRGGVRFDHENQQIRVCVRRIKRRRLERLEEFLAWKRRVIALAPLARAAEQHVGKRFFSEILKLRATTAWRVLREDRRKISGFFRQHQ